MDAKKFEEIMVRFHDFYLRNESHLNKIYDCLGCSPIEIISECSYLQFLIEVLSAAAATNSENAKAAQEDLEYLIYDCDFDLAEFCNRVQVNDKHPILSTFEDFYYFIKGE